MRRRFGGITDFVRLWSRRRTGFRPCASAAASTSLSPSESSAPFWLYVEFDIKPDDQAQFLLGCRRDINAVNLEIADGTLRGNYSDYMVKSWDFTADVPLRAGSGTR